MEHITNCPLSFEERTDTIRQLLGMPTEKALKILFEWYGSRHLIDAEFKEYATKQGYIK